METHLQEQLRSELIRLTEKQINTVEKRTSCGVSATEQYEKRQARIRDLFIEIHHLDPEA